MNDKPRTSQAQREAVKRYKEKNRAEIKRFTVDFHKSELDLYEHLSKQEKKQTYIKNLIRADMERSGKP